MSTSRQSPAPAGAQGSAPGRNRGSVPAQWRLAPQGPQARPSRSPVDELKERIASLFGQAHLDNLAGDNEALAHTLEGIADLDDRFRELCVLRG